MAMLRRQAVASARLPCGAKFEFSVAELIHIAKNTVTKRALNPVRTILHKRQTKETGPRTAISFRCDAAGRTVLLPARAHKDKATPLLLIAAFRGGSSGFHIQVGTFGFSVVAYLGEDCGGEPQERGLVGEERGDRGASLDLLVEPLESVRCSQPSPVCKWDHEYGGRLWGRLLKPSGELRSRFLVAGDRQIRSLGASSPRSAAGRSRQPLGSD